ncbi:uncharacterized protein LOC114359075 [Ostrinia furnacalis]|uniref:uncharacterized protein LOC114359075 n=1 Tax=Ostrinia furnacalis TaxID=93504 RepID=UPI00103A0B7C|nr:uncharacterized protein LOC114359075 [Ostrinia furnacalis]
MDIMDIMDIMDTMGITVTTVTDHGVGSITDTEDLSATTGTDLSAITDRSPGLITDLDRNPHITVTAITAQAHTVPTTNSSVTVFSTSCGQNLEKTAVTDAPVEGTLPALQRKPDLAAQRIRTNLKLRYL